MAGSRPVDDLPVALPKLVHCHLKDKRGEGRVWDFPAIGEGHIDFKRCSTSWRRAASPDRSASRSSSGRPVAAARRSQPGDEGVARQARFARPLMRPRRPVMKIGILGSGFMGDACPRLCEDPRRHHRGRLVATSRQGGAARRRGRRARDDGRPVDHRRPVDRGDQQHAADAPACRVRRSRR